MRGAAPYKNSFARNTGSRFFASLRMTALPLTPTLSRKGRGSKGKLIFFSPPLTGGEGERTYKTEIAALRSQ